MRRPVSNSVNVVVADKGGYIISAGAASNPHPAPASHGAKLNPPVSSTTLAKAITALALDSFRHGSPCPEALRLKSFSRPYLISQSL